MTKNYFFALFVLMIIFQRPVLCADGIFSEFIKPAQLNGKVLFQSNCAFCHSIQREMTGPALGSISKKRSEEWLLRFIKNSQEMISEGDKDATFLFEQYNNTVMPSFHKLSEQQINAILIYIETESVNPDVADRDFGGLDDYTGNESFRNGKVLFDGQCKTCHSVEKEYIGPALASVPKTRSMEWLIPFIKNSQKMIQSGDPAANLLYKKFNNTKMPPFDYLSEAQIKDILYYIKKTSESPTHIAGVNGRLIPYFETAQTAFTKSSYLSTYPPKMRVDAQELYEFYKYALIFIGLVFAAGFTFLIYRFFIALSR